MSVVIDEHDVTVLLGDVREQLATLPDGSVQCVVTSPPYYMLRDYRVDGQIGLEASPAEYVAEMVGVFREARRVLASDGVLWLNLGDSYNAYNGNRGESRTGFSRNEPMPSLPSGAGLTAKSLAPKNLLGIPWRVAFALQDDGWILRNAIIWHKTNAMPESVTDRLSSRYEHVFLFSKSRRYWFNLDPIRATSVGSGKTWAERKAAGAVLRHGLAGPKAADASDFAPNAKGSNPGDVWSIPTRAFSGAHFATMPAELARRCILAGCPDDGTVLDPFAGSGTTLKVARSLGRNSVGIELNPAYVDIIRDRIVLAGGA